MRKVDGVLVAERTPTYHLFVHACCAIWPEIPCQTHVADMFPTQLPPSPTSVEMQRDREADIKLSGPMV